MSSTPNEWTVMFFFGGDNELSPLIVPQVKAIKDAGFQANTQVVVYFDTNEKGIPTRIYNVNAERKAKKSPPQTEIGDGNDPWIHNMSDDNVAPNSLSASSQSAVGKMKDALEHPDSQTADQALKNFLGYCRENHQAEHYILILAGHGIIVGNDSFLSDDLPQSGISLKQLAEALKGFSNDNGTALELLAMHSCSMSALEISYELKGLANYMLASQGLSYVGSWPYRQLLKRIFGSIDKMVNNTNGSADSATDASGELSDAALALVEKLYYLSFYNARDFMIAGYSLDLALTSLKKATVEAIAEPLSVLVTKLRTALSDRRGQELILLAHWESQSYWREDYTDLFDFCLCLKRRCDGDIAAIEEQHCGDRTVAEGLSGAAHGVLQVLTPVSSANISERFSGLVVHADNIGWRYKYSHGLSVYFPWCEPLGDIEKSIMKNYESYAFHTSAAGNSWLDFLKDYFAQTKRKSRAVEDGRAQEEDGSVFRNLLGLNPFGALGDDPKPTPAYSGDPGKTSPIVGIGCSCSSIKNYPTEQVDIKGKRVLSRAFSITEGALNAHEQL